MKAADAAFEEKRDDVVKAEGCAEKEPRRGTRSSSPERGSETPRLMVLALVPARLVLGLESTKNTISFCCLCVSATRIKKSQSSRLLLIHRHHHDLRR